jgi:UDP-glucose 4-epimerase
VTAIVTGGLGFIGSHLTERLLADGPVTVVDDGRGGDHLAPGAALRKWPMEQAPFPPDADIIYHLAGPVGPVGVLRHAGRIVPDIIAMAATARDWALRNGCPLVYVSTSEVYGLQQQPMTEQAPRIIAAGHSARMEYAVAKLAAETMLLNTEGLDVRIVRPFNVAGPRQREDGGFVLPRFIRQAQNGEPLTVYQPGFQRRAFTHVLDIVDGLVRAGTVGTPGTVYNLGNPDNECSILELAWDVCRLVGGVDSRIAIVDPVTLWGPAVREAPDKVPDITKAREELGWNPTRDRRQVIEDAACSPS